MFGRTPGLEQMLKDRRRQEATVELPPGSGEPLPLTGQEHLVANARRRRQSSMMKQMLRDNGYDDLAKMIAIHEEKE